MSRRWRPDRRPRYAVQVQNAIWLIGLGILALTHAWWPGILLVIGVSMVAGALIRSVDPGPPPPPPPPPIFQPPPPRFEPAEPAPPPPPPPSERPRHLPDLCPNCGAPPRSLPVRDDHPGRCPYCGSALS